MHVRGALRVKLHEMEEHKKEKKKEEQKTKKLAKNNEKAAAEAAPASDEKAGWFSGKQMKGEIVTENVEEDASQAGYRRWEYRIFPVKSDESQSNYSAVLTKELNKLGNEGWELMGILHSKDKQKKGARLFLKREVSG